MRIFIEGTELYYPTDSPPSVTLEIERDAPFTFIASVSTVTVFVEGSAFARGGANQIATGDDVKIWNDGKTILLFGGVVDEEIDWEERDGYASFAVLGYGAELKDITLGNRYAFYPDFSRYRRISTSLEGLTDADKAKYSDERIYPDGLEQEIIAHPVTVARWDTEGKFHLLIGLEQESRFETRISSRGEYFPPEDRDPLFVKMLDADEQPIDGLWWRDTSKQYLRLVNIAPNATDPTSVLEEIVRQIKTAWGADRQVESYLVPDTITRQGSVRLIDVVAGTVDYVRRGDRLFAGVLQGLQTDTTAPLLKVYEIVNEYDAVELSNGEMQFGYSWQRYRDDMTPRFRRSDFPLVGAKVGLRQTYPVTDFVELKTNGRARIGTNKILYYRCLSRAAVLESVTASGNEVLIPAHRFIEQRLLGEAFVYDIVNDRSTFVGTFANTSRQGLPDDADLTWAVIQPALAAKLTNLIDWQTTGGEPEENAHYLGSGAAAAFDTDAGTFGENAYLGSTERIDTDFVQDFYDADNELQYCLKDNVPYAVGSLVIDALQFSFKDKSAFYVLTELCKLTNSVWWMDGNRKLFVTKRNYAAGTAHTLTNVIRDDLTIIDRTGEEPPEISSDIIDNENYNRELARWYNANFYAQQEEQWEVEVVADDTALAVKLGDTIVWRKPYPLAGYYVSRIEIGKESVTFTCWKAI